MIAGGRFGTNDLERAKPFYDAIAELTGAKLVMERPDLLAYQAEGSSIFLIGRPFAGGASAGNGNQLTIEAKSREMVDAVHAKAIELGGADEGRPGIRGDDPDGFYGAYFRDLDGNKWVIYRFGPA
ncbi:VOC family protein [Sphingorhabdus sp. M41]|uniref:VOC family protein n=1 Tax=Sphingorhabdus sp. M41 TaxID=1806885 RepID=UPI00078BF428|nr:VOC family protein [Sphingorhabdus sp. M41]AMO70595.1 glyoxalase [Sphingorhabdus sp. M41]|tara:strand:- start:41405 stop:41782 length:378 start_codon:yes stop_codon:yes gene_type:complete